MSDTPERARALRRYLATVPTGAESARRAVEASREMPAAERFDAFAALLREMDALLGGRMPVRTPDDLDFRRHWKDPLVGRRR